MLMPGRKYSAGIGYRYGFNGKENDNEIKGEGNEQDYGMRIYDPRLGRFLSVDPITSKYPELTPYQYASNRPIDGIDIDGLEWGAVMWLRFLARNGKTAQKQDNAERITWEQVYRAAELSYKSIKSMVDNKTPLIDNSWNRSEEYNTSRLAVTSSLNSDVTSDEVKKQNEQNVTIFFYDISYLAIMPGASEALSKVDEILNLEGASVEDKVLASRGLANLRRNEWGGINQAGLTFGSILLSYGGSTPDLKSLRISLINKGVSNIRATRGVSLVEALSKVGGNKAASRFLGWGNKSTILKTAADFTKDELIKAGYTKQVLTDIAAGLRQAATKTLKTTGELNPASIARAEQVEQIIKTHF
jgi:RHS repeat-associated protein